MHCIVFSFPLAAAGAGLGLLLWVRFSGSMKKGRPDICASGGPRGGAENVTNFSSLRLVLPSFLLRGPGQMLKYGV